MFGDRLALVPALVLVVAIGAPAANASQARASCQAPPAPPKTHSRRGMTLKHGATAAPKVSANCANAETSASRASGAAMSASVLCLINQQRATHGLSSLHENARFERAAQSRTNAMVRTGAFSHGTDFIGRIDAVGYKWLAAGEKVATGYATPRQIVTARMASLEHCRNVLDPVFADVGTGLRARGMPTTHRRRGPRTSASRRARAPRRATAAR